MAVSLLSSESSLTAAYVNESLGCNIRYIFILNPAKHASEPKIVSTESIRCSFFQTSQYFVFT